MPILMLHRLLICPQKKFVLVHKRAAKAAVQPQQLLPVMYQCNCIEVSSCLVTLLLVSLQRLVTNYISMLKYYMNTKLQLN